MIFSRKGAPKTLFISVCEVSGDRYAGILIKTLKQANPNLKIVGFGGAFSREAGMEILADLTPEATIGFLEPLRFIPKYLKVLRLAKRFFKQQSPDLVLAIDGQGFNVPLLKMAKSAGSRTAYYITPQEWQWGTVKGGRKVVSVVDNFFCIFPEAAEFYDTLGGRSEFVGHPLLDMAVSELDGYDFRQAYGIPKTSRIVAIFPGSRLQELRFLSETFIAAARALESAHEDLHFVISVVHEASRRSLEDLCVAHGLEAYSFYSDSSYELIANANLSLTATGTITLEHALLETPFVAAYGLSAVSYKVANFLVGKRFRERVRYLSLPNLILGEKVFPEFFQDAVSVAAIFEASELILYSESSRQDMQAKMRGLRRLLGSSGAVKRVARAILKQL